MATYQGKPTILLTGGSKGLGLAALEILLSRSYNVLSLSRTTPPELDALSARYPGALIISKGDVSKDDDNKQAVEMCMQSFGRLDALILNAGTLHPLGTHRSFTGSKLEEYKSLFDVNFFSLISIIGHALPYLSSREGKSNLSDSDPAGRIIAVSSGAATGGYQGWGAYSASKAAMNSLVRTLANEEEDVVAVAVRPGVVDSEMQEIIREKGMEHMKQSEHDKFTGLHSRGELLPPSKPGMSLASLAINATRDLSGEFVNWDEEKVKKLLFTDKGEEAA
ncbi:uncharacterized protein JCM6883_002120 [Sporobolomyces salmoneus]|uniref:uncharacterized protein n=1 Tax=Sporobolomyces salmoneus TaxID=183962 RepID=UPI00317AB886